MTTIKKYNSYAVTLVLLIATLIVSCSDPNEGELFVTPASDRAEMSITDVLESSDYDGQFSEWLQLLRYTNFYNALKNASATATVFAPTNDAMKKFLASRGVETVEEFYNDDPEYARAVVQEHIISGKKYFDNEIDMYASQKNYLPQVNLFGKYVNLSYGYIDTECDDDERTGVYENVDSIYINSQARLQRFEADTCQNGVFYIMADVIKPLAETIYQTLDKDDTYSIFAAAVKECGYDSIANKYQDTTRYAGGKYVVNTYKYTCFAVPDAVYRAAGINDVSSLKNYIVSNKSDKDEFKDENDALNKYMQYHFLQREYTVSELFNFMGGEDLLVYPVKLAGQSIVTNNPDLKDEEGNKLFDGNYINKDVKILRSDKETRNGYIHKISSVMNIYHPDPVPMKWDFLNSADLISIVNAWGMDNSKGNVFTSSLGMDNTVRYDFTKENNYKTYGSPTSFTYLANSTKASTNTYPAVGFWKDFISGTSAAYGAYMDNFLCLNLGYNGYVEFTTPSVIAGRYKVVLHYLAERSSQNLISGFFNSGTSTRIELDDNLVTKLLYKGVTFPRKGFSYQNYTSAMETLWDSMEFEETTTHTFRVTLRDILAKDNSYYHLMLDYVEFIPLD
ncbi:MAG: DUF5108 domain-containing protein [Prevotella sp.]|nr:DUF5108 domain-containing protein [Prevotella sp.]MBQ8058201.1 DUF5108 domain-containing protein [Prevotella sp.]